MILDTKPVDSITEEDLQKLLSEGKSEGKDIDYKRDNYGRGDQDKKEFFKDVSSFANASGGYLLIGVDEEKGIPTDIVGIKVDDIDQEKQRIESLLMDNIKPRLPGLKIKEVS